MANTIGLRCDGCGQTASPEHLDRRLRRLEWATRYRPVHIQTLLLGAFTAYDDADYLYSPAGEFRGEARLLLDAVGISPDGKPAEVVRTEFQRNGYFLAHILECPLEIGPGGERDSAKLLKEHLPAAASRIRRSLKPKCVMLITEVLEPVVKNILSLDLGCPVVLDEGKPFKFSSPEQRTFSRFRELLSAARGN